MKTIIKKIILINVRIELPTWFTQNKINNTILHESSKNHTIRAQ